MYEGTSESTELPVEFQGVVLAAIIKVQNGSSKMVLAPGSVEVIVKGV